MANGSKLPTSSPVQIHQIQRFADDAAQWGETQGGQKDTQLIGV